MRDYGYCIHWMQDGYHAGYGDLTYSTREKAAAAARALITQHQAAYDTLAEAGVVFTWDITIRNLSSEPAYDY